MAEVVREAYLRKDKLGVIIVLEVVMDLSASNRYQSELLLT